MKARRLPAPKAGASAGTQSTAAKGNLKTLTQHATSRFRQARSMALPRSCVASSPQKHSKTPSGDSKRFGRTLQVTASDSGLARLMKPCVKTFPQRPEVTFDVRMQSVSTGIVLPNVPELNEQWQSPCFR